MLDELRPTTDHRPPTTVTNNSTWYAVHTRPRSEKKVAGLLMEKGIENYCPLNKVTRQWSDRKKTVLEPVFKGYVFVKLAEKNKWEVRKIPGVLNFVFWLGKPAQIRETEIITIKKFLDEFENVEVGTANLTTDSKVRIKQGIFMNYEGMVIQVFGNRAVVKIDSLGMELSAHFERGNLEVIG